jgi:hypothetical protein
MKSSEHGSPERRSTLEHNLDRAISLLARTPNPLDAFDRLGRVRECEGRSLGELLDEFAIVRREKIAVLRALNPSDADFAKRGRYPALG